MSRSRPAWELLLPHDGAGLAVGCGVQAAGPGIGPQPVPGGLVGVAEVEAVLVQPAAHVGLMDEGQVQPVVACSRGFVLRTRSAPSPP
jgi:hypothetical protein